MTTVREAQQCGVPRLCDFSTHINGDRTQIFEFRVSGQAVRGFRGPSSAMPHGRKGGRETARSGGDLPAIGAQPACSLAWGECEGRTSGTAGMAAMVTIGSARWRSPRHSEPTSCNQPIQYRNAKTGPWGPFLFGWCRYSGPMLVQLFAALACFCRTGSCGRYLPLLTSRDMAYSPHQGPAAQ